MAGITMACAILKGVVGVGNGAVGDGEVGEGPVGSGGRAEGAPGQRSSEEPPGTVLAVDLGGTHLRCAVVTPDGGIVAHHRVRTPRDDSAGALFAELRRFSAGTEVSSAVVGLPGRVDYQEGRLEHAPNLPRSWAEQLDEGSLAAAVGMPVAVANDADLAAVGEAWFGAGRSWSDVAYVTVSTGIGAGVVLGDRLVHGRRSLAEIGHTLVQPPSGETPGAGLTVEDLASGPALVRRAAQAGFRGDAPEVVAGVAAGDARLQRSWDEHVAAVGLAVVNLAWLFTPQVMVVGGGLGLVGGVLLDPVAGLLRRYGPPGLAPPIALVPAALGDDAALIGAAGWSRAFKPEAAGRR